MKIALRVLTLLMAGLLLNGCSEQNPSNQAAEQSQYDIVSRAKQLAQQTIIVDTHIDVPYRLQDAYEDVSQATAKGDFDYPRALAGGLNVPFMSIYIPAEYEQQGGAVKLADQLIDGVEKIANAAPEKFALAYNVADVERNFTAGKISLAMGMENGAPIDGNLENLQHFYQRGIRYITLAHSKSNHISDSSYDDNRQWQGLSDFGKQLVLEMNKIGMMVDISHVSDAAFYQAVEISQVPVIASHSSARHFTPGFERNMSDDMIKALAKNGGVIQINFGSAFVSQASRDSDKVIDDARDAYMQEHTLERKSPELKAFVERFKQEHPYRYASLDEVLDHFDHVVALVGIDHVGIGSDYDGVGDSLPEGLKDVSTYPNLIAGLLQRGYTEAEITKILSGNILRVWRAVEDYAKKTHDKP